MMPVDADPDDVDAAGLPDRLLRKAETAIHGRTSRVVCVIERCTDEHNYSAVIRTAEALGVQHIWLVDPVVQGGDEDLAPESAAPDAGAPGGGGATTGWRRRGHGQSWRDAHKLFARRANEFTTIREFPTTAACIAALREDRRVIWATDLSQSAVPMTEPALRAATSIPDGVNVVPERLAIVFGTESVGCTQEILRAADLRVYLPLRGFADSLNLSVAAALCIHELFHLCPEAVGAMPESERAALRAEWFPRLLRARVVTRAEEKRAREVKSKIDKARRRRDEASARGEPPNAAVAATIDALEKEAAAWEATVDARAAEAAAPSLANPPTPLRDMRRPDEHREAFVGKNVRARNAEHWAGMAAVARSSGLADEGAGGSASKAARTKPPREGAQ